MIPLRAYRAGRPVMTAAAQVPTIYEWRDVDATASRAVEASARTCREGSPRITCSLVARAVVTAVPGHPQMNASYDPEAEELTIRPAAISGSPPRPRMGCWCRWYGTRAPNSGGPPGTIADLTTGPAAGSTRGGDRRRDHHDHQLRRLGVGFGTPLLRYPR